MPIKEEFRRELGRALAHLYDLAYLEVSPLAAAVPDEGGAPASRGRRLRKTIIDTIQALRPPEGTPSDDGSAWQPFRILEGRYIAGASHQAMEQQLSLSQSQFYREHARAVEALFAMLWRAWNLDEREGFQSGIEGNTHVDKALVELEELARQEGSALLDIGELLNDLMSLFAGSTQSRGATLHADLPDGPLWARSVRTVLRHGLIAVLTELIDSATEGDVGVRALHNRGEIEIRFVVSGHRGQSVQPAKLEALRKSLQIAGATLRAATEDEKLVLAVRLAAIEGQHNILLVDNSRDLYDLFARYLEHEPWTLRYAASVTQALEICEEELPWIVLLDLLMPHRDGWNLLRSLKAQPRTERVPVVICSVVSEPHLALSLGASSYLQKPIGRDTLLEAINRWARHPEALDS